MPATGIVRVSAGRAGGASAGASSTDVMVELAGAQSQLFSNVAMDDVPPLLGYARRLAARQAKDTSGSAAASARAPGSSTPASSSAASSSSAAVPAAGSVPRPGRASHDDDDEEADEDFRPEGDDSAEDAGPVAASRPLRAAVPRAPKRAVAVAPEPVARRTRSRAAAAPAEELCLLDANLDIADAELLPSSGEEAGGEAGDASP